MPGSDWAPIYYNLKIIEVWGLTLCENKNCSLIHNRDKNSALNMYKITQSIYINIGKLRKKVNILNNIYLMV